MSDEDPRPQSQWQSLLQWLRAEWDRTAAVLLVCGGAVVLLLGYVGVANADYVPQALSYIASGGIGGIGLVGVGAALWVSADLRDDARRMERLERVLRSQLDSTVGGVSDGPGVPTGGPPVRRAHLVLLLAFVVGACGSGLSEQQLRASQGPLLRRVVGQATSNQLSPGGAVSQGRGPSTATTAAPSDAATGGNAGTSATPHAGAQGSLVFGWLGTASGPVGANLASVPVAVRAWVADVNSRGGIGGRRVEMLYGDDGADPGKALAIVRDFVETKHVVALVSASAPLTLQAVTPYLEKQGVPVVGTDGTNPVADTSPMVFQPNTGASLGVPRSFVTSLTAASKNRRASILYCREAATCSDGARAIRDYAPKAGVQIVHEAQVSLAQPDFTAEVIAARNAGADAVFVYLDGASVVRVVRAAHRQGWNPAFDSGPGPLEESFLTTGGADIDGYILAATTAPYFGPKMREYRDAVNRFVPGGVLGGTGGMAWVGGKLAERAISMISGTVTPSAIVASLQALRNEDLGGLVPPITFIRQGDRSTMNLCTIPVVVSGGRFTTPAGDAFVCADHG